VAPDQTNPSEPSLFSSVVESAIRLAARGHYHQFRKRSDSYADPDHVDNPLPCDHVPYITHLMGTMCILARLGAPDHVLAAAVLHDYLEDVPDPDGPERIRTETGDEVLELVSAVTENKRPGLDSGATWEIRKREQLERLETMPEPAVLIKCADVLHNLLSLEMDLFDAADRQAVWDRFNATRQRQLWYFGSILGAARNRLGDHPLVDELDAVIARVKG
jgi:(p)ppGpp synthase/HD superfamily hydrolase